jgi:antitoxin component YwqK of YwqJK toxin-antitoxin module
LALLLSLLAGAPAPDPARAAENGQTREIRTPSGLLRWEVRIAEDGRELRHGRFMRFHGNGAPALEGRYRDDEPAGIWNWWDESGNLLRTIEYEYGVAVPLRGDSLRQPTFAFTLLDGRKTAEGLLKGDKPHGRWQFWYLNGAWRAEGEYLSGIPHGRWTYYYPDGHLEREARYEMGVLHGEFREAYPNGQERRRGRIDQGLKVGTWRFWYPDGRLRAEGAWVGDREDGEWRFWDEQGVLIRRIIYRAGKAVQELEIPAEERSRAMARITTEDDLLPPPILVDEQGQIIRPREP